MIKLLYLPVTALVIFIFYITYGQQAATRANKTSVSEHGSEHKKEIIIYSKELCIYCTKAKNFFEKRNIKYINIDITDDYDQFKILENETNQSTVPFIFINGNFIGGYSDLLKLDQEGKFNELIAS